MVYNVTPTADPGLGNNNWGFVVAVVVVALAIIVDLFFSGVEVEPKTLIKAAFIVGAFIAYAATLFFVDRMFQGYQRDSLALREDWLSSLKDLTDEYGEFDDIGKIGRKEKLEFEKELHRQLRTEQEINKEVLGKLKNQ